MKIHRLLHTALPIALLMTFTVIAHSQEADTDKAKALLKQSIDEFKALQFETAKATLLKVKGEGLSEAEVDLRDDYLLKVDTAIRRQREARETLREAEKALKANNLAEAISGFEGVLKSEYLTKPELDDAKANLALAREKAKTTPTMEWKPTRKVGPEPTAKPEPVAAAKPETMPTTRPEEATPPKPEGELVFEPAHVAAAEPEPTTRPEPMIRLEPIVVAKPETEPQIKPEQVEPARPEAEPQVKPEQVEAAKPEAEPEIKPEQIEAPKPEPERVEVAKPEAKPEIKPEQIEAPKPEPERVEAAKPEAEPEIKPEQIEAPKPEPERVEVAKPEAKPEIKPEQIEAPKPEPERVEVAKPEAKPEIKPEQVEAPKLEPERVEAAKPEAEPEIKPEPIVVTKPEAEPPTTVEPKTEPVVVVGIEAESKPTTKPETVVAAEPEEAVKPATEPTTEPALVVAAEPETKPTTIPTTQEGIIAKLQAQRQAKAQEYLQIGKQAMKDSNIAKAVEYFGRALDLAPDNAEVKRLHEMARNRLAVSGETVAMSVYEQQRMIGRQIAQVETDKRIKKSREVLAAAVRAADFDEAIKLARSAKTTLEMNQNFFGPDEYRDELLKIESYMKFAASRKEEWERAETVKIRKEQEKLERDRITREEQERRRKIETLTKSARLLRAEQSYKQALEAVDQLLKLDPRNPWAIEQRDILEQFVMIQDRKDAVRDRRIEETKLFVEIESKLIPWYDIIHYPRNWEEIRKRAEKYGATAAGESEEDRAVRQKLRTIIPTLDFDEIPLKDAVEFIRNMSGCSLFVNWRALQLRGIDKTTEVTVHLTKVPVETALRMVLNDAGGAEPLEYVISDGVITISSKEDLSKKMIVRVYDIRHLLFRVPNFAARRQDLSDTMGQGGAVGLGQQQGGVFGQGQGAAGAGAAQTGEENVVTRTEMINNHIELIKSTIDPPSWTTGEAAIKETQGQLVVTQTAKNHQDLARLLNQLQEARGIQISIEARYLQVNTGFLNSIGVDFDMYFNLGSVANTPGGGATDPFTGARVPVTTPPVGRWGGTGGGNSLTPMGIVTSGSQRTVPAFTGTGLFAESKSTGIRGIGSPGISFAGVFLDDVQVDFLLQATQAHEATRSLTAPRITVWNGQRSQVSVGTQVGYVSGYNAVTSLGEGQPAIIPQVSYVSTGSTLDVEATVSADRKYVIMTLRPRVTTLRSVTPRGFSADPNANILDIPQVDVQEMETTVMVPDGGTLLLGGQTIAAETERELGVPLLSKVPVINRLFTNRGKVRDQQTLLYLIKPIIIIQEEQEEKQFPT